MTMHKLLNYRLQPHQQWLANPVLLYFIIEQYHQQQQEDILEK